MTRDKLKQLVKDVLIENSELALTSTSQQIDNSSTAEDFVKKLVGKKLKGLLDATGYARLYILNKYGVGGHPDEEDIQANVANLMDNVTAFINFRKLDKLGKQRDDWDKEQYAKPEYKEWLKQRALAFKAYRDARDSNSTDVDELRKKYQTVASSDPTLSDYRKMTADKETLVNQIHNTPLTIDDVLPRQDDTDADKKRWSAVERSFNKLKNLRKENIMTKKELKELIKEVLNENYEKKFNDGTQIQLNYRGELVSFIYKGTPMDVKLWKDLGWSNGWTSDKRSEISPKLKRPSYDVEFRPGGSHNIYFYPEAIGGPVYYSVDSGD